MKVQVFLFFSEALSKALDKASEKKRNTCTFYKFCVFLIYIYI